MQTSYAIEHLNLLLKLNVSKPKDFMAHGLLVATDCTFPC